MVSPAISHTSSSMPGEPTWRAMSAETMKTPEPIMDPATSAVASTRVKARTNSTGERDPVPAISGSGAAESRD